MRISIKMQKNELRVNFYTPVLNTKLLSLGNIYWSIPESFNVTADQWAVSAHSITLPSGIYIISAHAELPAGDSPATLRVDNLLPVQRYVTIPPNLVHARRATVAFIADISSEEIVTTSVYCQKATTVNTCEVSALRIK